jgi:AAA+ superfamily predicted ATPase
MSTKKKRLRPEFLEDLGRAYTYKRKNVIVLTGDVYGTFFSPVSEDYLGLEDLLFSELSSKFNIIRMDIATGLGFYSKSTEAEVYRVCESKDGIYIPTSRMKALSNMIESSRHNPLASLVLLEGICESYRRVRKIEPDIRPLCAVLQFGASFFPTGDFSRLAEIDRQRLVFFLNWMNKREFQEGPELVVIVNKAKSELNDKVLALPNVANLQIKLPSRDERYQFIRYFTSSNKPIKIKGGQNQFADDTAGLALGQVKDILEMGLRTHETIDKETVVKEVNQILQVQLGDIIRIKYPSHGPGDIIGYKETGQIFMNVFERCEDPETAVAAILVSGPNGSGKTFQLEAYAAHSGRVVVELAGIRGSYFGETDRFFELLRWHIATFGKILILVDEAHTAFGSVHESGIHSTEKRLAGNIIKMMGDNRYLGKVLWGLMTSRPDQLDPDIKSRASVQIPIFDMNPLERREFLAAMFKRKSIKTTKKEVEQLINATLYYSARDYRNFTAEVLAQKRKTPEKSALEVLSGWQASKSIIKQREFQELIASLHCSYPALLPEAYRNMDEYQIQAEIEKRKIMLHR